MVRPEALSSHFERRLLVGATVPPARLREVIWELDHKLVPTYPLPSVEDESHAAWRLRSNSSASRTDSSLISN